MVFAISKHQAYQQIREMMSKIIEREEKMTRNKAFFCELNNSEALEIRKTSQT